MQEQRGVAAKPIRTARNKQQDLRTKRVELAAARQSVAAVFAQLTLRLRFRLSLTQSFQDRVSRSKVCSLDQGVPSLPAALRHI